MSWLLPCIQHSSHILNSFTLSASNTSKPSTSKENGNKRKLSNKEDDACYNENQTRHPKSLEIADSLEKVGSAISSAIEDLGNNDEQVNSSNINPQMLVVSEEFKSLNPEVKTDCMLAMITVIKSFK